MGMYTAFRFNAKIKEEYAEAINYLMENKGHKKWSDVADEFFEYNVFEYFSTYSRANFIPFSDPDGSPDSWKNDEEYKDSFDKETRLWKFQCSLKNYDSTIEFFLDVVARRIVEVVYYVETFYEESEKGSRYDLVNGEFEIVDSVGYTEEELYGKCE